MIHPLPALPPGFASHALPSLQRVQRGMSPVELIYMAHEHWPLRPGQTIHARPTLCISVLDSSFNPPTVAHLALANSPPPSSPRHLAPASASAEPYDAQLLLLSVRNADKVLKQGDATFIQRLEMMHLLSLDMSRCIDAVEPNNECPQTSGNVAIAITAEPTFVGKSALLLRFLQARLAAVVGSRDSDSLARIPDRRNALCPAPRLTFLLGFDTLTRLFSPKYYTSEQVMVQMLRSFFRPDQDDSRVVCAHRQSAGVAKTLEVANEFITSDRITFIDIGTEEQTYSSSQVREKIAAGDHTWKRLVTNGVANYIINRRIFSHPGGG